MLPLFLSFKPKLVEIGQGTCALSSLAIQLLFVLLSVSVKFSRSPETNPPHNLSIW
jgi:hypothetical protein